MRHSPRYNGAFFLCSYCFYRNGETKDFSPILPERYPYKRFFIEEAKLISLYLIRKKTLLTFDL